MPNAARTADLEALIEAEYASLRSHFEDRLVPLLVERALRMARGPVPPAPDLAPSHDVEGTLPEHSLDARPAAPRAGGHVAQLIVDALWDAPGHRLPGRTLSDLIVGAGYTIDASEKNKTRLKKLGVLVREIGTGHWALAPRFLDPGATIPRNDMLPVPDPSLTEAGRSIMDALSRAHGDGLDGNELLRLAEGHGLAPSRARLVRHRLRAAGHIDFVGGPGGRWHLSAPDRGGSSDAGSPTPGSAHEAALDIRACEANSTGERSSEVVGGEGTGMKAGNENRVVLIANDGRPWGVALGYDCKAEHEGGKAGLLDWLGIPKGAETVTEACCAPKAPGPDWALVQHDDEALASLLVLNDDDARLRRTKRMGIRRKHLGDGETFHGASQDDDTLATAYDETSVALAAFRPDDRRLLADLADALGRGRLAVADGQGTGPILVLADRVPGDARLRSIGEGALMLANDEDGNGIDYAVHPVDLLETGASKEWTR